MMTRLICTIQIRSECLKTNDPRVSLPRDHGRCLSSRLLNLEPALASKQLKHEKCSIDKTGRCVSSGEGMPRLIVEASRACRETSPCL